MKTLILKIALFASLFQLFGCTYAFYRPTTMNTPNFKEKNEVHLAVNANTTTQSIGVDVAAAYALTNHLFIQGNYMNISDVASVEGESTVGFNFFSFGSQEAKRSFTSGEYGAGYFTAFGKIGTFSVVGGYGLGKAENIVKKGKYSADFNKMFLQSSLGLRENNVEVVGSAKLSVLNYRNLDYIKSSGSDEYYKTFSNSIPILEGGLVARLGGEKIKFQMQTTAAIALVSRPLFEYDWLTLSAGVCVQLSTKKKAK